MEQTDHPVSYCEVKTIIKSQFHSDWKRNHQVSDEKDLIWQLNRPHQVVIFRLRTGHCRLCCDMYKLRLCHTEKCDCGTGVQTPEHFLQSCPSFKDLRQEVWPKKWEYVRNCGDLQLCSGELQSLPSTLD